MRFFKKQKKDKWDIWYAWYPVVVPDKYNSVAYLNLGFVWLEKVYRRKSNNVTYYYLLDDAWAKQAYTMACQLEEIYEY